MHCFTIAKQQYLISQANLDKILKLGTSHEALDFVKELLPDISVINASQLTLLITQNALIISSDGRKNVMYRGTVEPLAIDSLMFEAGALQVFCVPDFTVTVLVNGKIEETLGHQDAISALQSSCYFFIKYQKLLQSSEAASL